MGKIWKEITRHLWSGVGQHFYKSQIENISGFVCRHFLCLVTTQLCYCSKKTDINFKWITWLYSNFTLLLDTDIWFSYNFLESWNVLFSTCFQLLKNIKSFLACVPCKNRQQTRLGLQALRWMDDFLSGWKKKVRNQSWCLGSLH